MALNKLDLINKVRRMRDVIDGAGADSGEVTRSLNQAADSHQEITTSRLKNEEDNNNNRIRVAMTSRPHHQENSNFPRNERLPKRIEPVEAANGPVTARQQQCNRHDQTGAQNDTHHRKESIKSQVTKLEATSAKETMQRTQHHQSTGGANCGATATKTRPTAAAKQQTEPMVAQSGHYHCQQEHHPHLGHAPTCNLAAQSRLQVSAGEQSSQAKFHQPHCIYHNPSGGHHCPTSSQQHHLISRPTNENVVLSGETRCKQQPTAAKYLNSRSHHHHHHQPSTRDPKYLLVEYRPGDSHGALNNRSHLPEGKLAGSSAPDDVGGGGAGSCRRTTIKFISQLYFLLHLSVTLSLLLHHKNLVISESKLPDNAQLSNIHYSSASPGVHLVKQSILVNDTVAPTTSTPIVVVNPLPVPLMLMAGAGSHSDRARHRRSTNSSSQRQQQNVIRSVVVAQSSHADGIHRMPHQEEDNGKSRRFGRQVAAAASSPISLMGAPPTNYQQHQLLSQTNPDILVRLVGPLHARYALRYFLSYLLVTSVVVLVCLRLFRLCNCRQRQRSSKRKLTPAGASATTSNSSSSAEQSSANQQESSENYGFYQRTRLDCTPVLIGSISLGLIQLIVIGLDVAYNIDWLNESIHWPTSLPLLQFAFVSLLMQYILGKVAKKQGQRKSGPRSDGASAKSCDELDKQRAAALSISYSGRRYNNREQPFNLSPAANREQPPISGASSSGGSGFENIALAHLLVTHILLWLMKLNSISLFQAIEHHHTNQPPRHHQHQQQSISARLFPPDHQSPLLPRLPPAILATGVGGGAGQAYSPRAELPTLQAPSGRPMVRIQPARPPLEPPPSRPPAIDPAIEDAGSQRNPEASPDLLDSKQQEQPEPIEQDNHTSTTTSTTTTTTSTTSTTSAPTVLEPHSSSKPERGHRSALDRSLGTNTSGAETLGQVNSSQHSSSGLDQATGGATQTNATNKPTAMADPLPGPPPPPPKPQVKSSLPKRMTAFRQRPPSSSYRLNPPSSAPAAGSSVVATQLAAGSGPSTTQAPPRGEPPVGLMKQRARVMIQRVEDPVHLESPETEAARQRRRAKQVRPPPTTERPFPSVETDPPAPLSPTPTPSSTRARTEPASNGHRLKSTTMRAHTGSAESGSRSAKNASRSDYETLASSVERTTNRTRALQPPVTTRAPAGKRVKVGEGEGDTVGSILEEVDRNSKMGPQVATEEKGLLGELATEEESGLEDDIEESDIDLDSLLPPVPNYGEAASSEEDPTEVLVKGYASHILEPSSEELSIELPLNETGRYSQTEGRKSRRPKKVFDLSELDAFAFNEAATEVVNSTVLPAPEALISGAMREKQQQQQRQQQERGGTPTFADYLMPIVHQYHILIAAILFNMWLDGLRSAGTPTKTTKLPRVAAHSHQDISFSNQRLISSRDLLLAAGSPSASELGSMSPGSSGGLVAIPIHRRPGRSTTAAKYVSAGFALQDRSTGGGGGGGHWRQLSDRHHQPERSHHHRHHHRHHYHVHGQQHYRSRSMDSLHLVASRELHADETSSSSSAESTLSRRHSVRSASSQQQLLWVPGRSRSPLLGRQVLAPFALRQTSGGGGQLGPTYAGRLELSGDPTAAVGPNGCCQSRGQAAANSVCSVFFGLIVVSITLIVILIGIDLLSVITQCLTQLISIIVCLLGLLLTWRLQVRANRQRNKTSPQGGHDGRLCHRRRPLHQLVAGAPQPPTKTEPTGDLASAVHHHRQCFHYLFLLAAYYCGISIALNLSKQHSMQQLFSQQVIQFIHRHYHQASAGTSFAGGSSSGRFMLHEPLLQPHHQASRPPDFLVASLANYLFLFHAILVVKGLLLVVQVTLQTLLIRSSYRRTTKELRQIYTFLMFANLSLWALEICEQQQHLQRDSEGAEPNAPDRHNKLISLDSFTRFAASIVTLSHLYHGLVFMQQ